MYEYKIITKALYNDGTRILPAAKVYVQEIDAFDKDVKTEQKTSNEQGVITFSSENPKVKVFKQKFESQANQDYNGMALTETVYIEGIDGEMVTSEAVLVYFVKSLNLEIPDQYKEIWFRYRRETDRDFQVGKQITAYRMDDIILMELVYAKDVLYRKTASFYRLDTIDFSALFRTISITLSSPRTELPVTFLNERWLYSTGLKMVNGFDPVTLEFDVIDLEGSNYVLFGNTRRKEEAEHYIEIGELDDYTVAYDFQDECEDDFNITITILESHWDDTVKPDIRLEVIKPNKQIDYYVSDNNGEVALTNVEVGTRLRFASTDQKGIVLKNSTPVTIYWAYRNGDLQIKAANE